MRIVLIEDSVHVRRALLTRFAQEHFLTVVGQASGVRDGIATAVLSQADAVVLDLSLPDGNGLDVLGGLRQAQFGGYIFMLSANPTNEFAFACRSHGANGYYDKAFDIERLVDDLREIASGERPGQLRTLKH